jgi:DNA-binding NtrC family response regulator
MGKRLDTQQQEFFKAITRAIYANPFSKKRREEDVTLTGLSPETKEQEILARLIDLVAEQVRGLQKHNMGSLGYFNGEERDLVRNLFVFHLFHKYIDPLDQHIQQQSTISTPMPLDCGEAIMQDLLQCGCTAQEAERYLALFFQMRRAFYFIRHSLVGCSQSMEQLRSQLWNNIFTRDIATYAFILWNRLEDFSTLLLGETGTGKGVVAAAIGRSGFIPYDRKKGTFTESFASAFLSINLSQYPEQLIESELFGHARGAFTGAIKDHRGIFARSSPHGAVFLDEIGEVSTPIQIKLLRVLEERVFTPVGSSKQQRFAGRVIGATNRDLDSMRLDGRFRNDFYYRLSSDSITVPSLRTRLQEAPEELELMVDFLLTRITGKKQKRLLPQIVSSIRQRPGTSYPWPGNVRELDQCIRQILLHGEYRSVVQEKTTGDISHLAMQMESGDLSAAELLSGYCSMLLQRLGTYQEVARKTGLDRRTVKKYVDAVDLNKEH